MKIKYVSCCLFVVSLVSITGCASQSSTPEKEVSYPPFEQCWETAPKDRVLGGEAKFCEPAGIVVVSLTRDPDSPCTHQLDYFRPSFYVHPENQEPGYKGNLSFERFAVPRYGTKYYKAVLRAGRYKNSGLRTVKTTYNGPGNKIVDTTYTWDIPRAKEFDVTANKILYLGDLLVSDQCGKSLKLVVRDFLEEKFELYEELNPTVSKQHYVKDLLR